MAERQWVMLYEPVHSTGYCVTVWFGRTEDRKMAERQWVMLYEPVHCTGYCVTVWFGRTVDRKMAERQWVMMYEPVHCTGFPLFQFLQGVEVPEKYSPSQSMTPSVSTQVCLPHVLPYCRRRTQVGELISGGGVKSWSYFEDGMCIGVDRDISGYPLETDLTGPEH